MLRSMVLRGNALTQTTRLAASRAMSSQALSNPTLSNIEKRWEGMPLQEQADLWMALRDRMKGSWNDLTLQEKKAGRWCTLSFRENPSRESWLKLPASIRSCRLFSFPFSVSRGPTSAHTITIPTIRS